MRTRALAGGVAGLVLLLAGCGGGAQPAAPASSAAPSAAAESGTLTVLAAASLTETFNALEKRFETDHPGVDVKLNYAGSSDLAQQIVNGAPADVFAAASDATMKTVTDAGLAAGTPTIFATNVLQIATAPGNPKGIASFADLAKPDLKVVVCAPQVPCGAAAEKIEKATGVTLRPVSEEADVKSTLGKVTSGDADAGLVYVTDVSAAGDSVQGVSFPEANQATTNYPIAVAEERTAGAAGAAVRRPGDRDRRAAGAQGSRVRPGQVTGARTPMRRGAPGMSRGMHRRTDATFGAYGRPGRPVTVGSPGPVQVHGQGSQRTAARPPSRCPASSGFPPTARSRWSRCPSSGSCCGPTGRACRSC